MGISTSQPIPIAKMMFKLALVMTALLAVSSASPLGFGLGAPLLSKVTYGPAEVTKTIQPEATQCPSLMLPPTTLNPLSTTTHCHRLTPSMPSRSGIPGCPRSPIPLSSTLNQTNRFFFLFSSLQYFYFNISIHRKRYYSVSASLQHVMYKDRKRDQNTFLQKCRKLDTVNTF